MNVQIINFSNPLWLETLQKMHHDIYHLPEYVNLEAQRINAKAEAIVIDDCKKVFFYPI